MTFFYRWNPGWTLGQLNYHRMASRGWRVRRHSLRLGRHLFIWGRPA